MTDAITPMPMKDKLPSNSNSAPTSRLALTRSILNISEVAARITAVKIMLYPTEKMEPCG